MKRFVCAALTAALLIPSALAINARAHDDGDEPGPHHEMSEKMAGKMKEKLGLTDDQAAKLRDARKAHQEAMKPLMKALHDGFEKLESQLKSKAADQDIQATLDSLKSTRQSMASEQEKFHAALASFLTPTQQAKMVVTMGRRMHEMHERMEHRGKKGAPEAGDEKEEEGE